MPFARSFAQFSFGVAALILAGRLVVAPASAHEEAVPPKPLIGVCDVWTIAYELALSNKYKQDDQQLKEERDRATKNLREELKALSDKIDAMRKDGVDPDSNEELRGLMDKYYRLDRDVDEKMEAFSAQRETMFAQRLRDGCETVCDVAQQVSEERGFTYVLSSCDLKAMKHVQDLVREMRAADRDPEDEDAADAEDEGDRLTFNEVFYSERYRIVAAGPENIRIDDLIRDRLHLPPVPGN